MTKEGIKIINQQNTLIKDWVDLKKKNIESLDIKYTYIYNIDIKFINQKHSVDK